jgi:hypothetical protein
VSTSAQEWKLRANRQQAAHSASLVAEALCRGSRTILGSLRKRKKGVGRADLVGAKETSATTKKRNELPQGKHDDCVMALALGYQGRKQIQATAPQRIELVMR